MTDTSAALDLLAECQAHGIGVASDDDGRLTIDAPRDALTNDLLTRLRASKAELLAMLRAKDAATMASPDEMQRRDPDAGQWIERTGPDGQLSYVRLGVADTHVIEPDALTQCQTCAGQDMWQTLAGNWRCTGCDPPTTAQRLRVDAAQLRTRPHSRDRAARRGGISAGGRGGAEAVAR
jgi:hypothetical protein